MAELVCHSRQKRTAIKSEHVKILAYYKADDSLLSKLAQYTVYIMCLRFISEVLLITFKKHNSNFVVAAGYLYNAEEKRWGGSFHIFSLIFDFKQIFTQK